MGGLKKARYTTWLAGINNIRPYYTVRPHLRYRGKNTSVADPDPESGAFLTPRSGMRGPGWVKQSGSGSGMNNPDHISESLATIFWAKILKFFDADPGSGMKRIRIRDGKNSDPGLTSRIRNTD
jgi:hypothetical protein